MFLIHGVYNFNVRRVAFRRDHCRTCRAPRLAVRVRSFDVVHLFWIPVLPIGVWRRWFCATCKHPPHDAPGTRRPFKFLAVPLLALMSASMWADMPEAEPRLLWPLRIGLPVLTLVTLVWALRHVPEPDVERALNGVAPFSGARCPVCGEGEYLDSPYWRCRVCGVRHEPLPRRAALP